MTTQPVTGGPVSGQAFAGASLQLMSEIVRQAEARLDNQSELARAVDQRALALAGLAGAFAGAAIAKSIESWSTQPALAHLAAGVGLSLLLSMLFAALAARPARLFVTCNLPSNWVDDIREGRTFEACLGDTAALYDRYIRANDTRLHSRGLFLRISLWFLFAAPIMAIAAFYALPLVAIV